MSRDSATTKFSGWLPNKRDRFERWMCNRVLEEDINIGRWHWFAWMEAQWRDWRQMQVEAGLPIERWARNEKLPIDNSGGSELK